MAQKGKSQPRTRQQIESDLTAARTRLSANLESLIDQVHPATVKERQVQGVKTMVANEVNAAKSQFQTSSGDWRTDRLALVGGVAAGAVALVITLSVIAAKKKNA